MTIFWTSCATKSPKELRIPPVRARVVCGWVSKDHGLLKYWAWFKASSRRKGGAEVDTLTRRETRLYWKEFIHPWWHWHCNCHGKLERRHGSSAENHAHHARDSITNRNLNLFWIWYIIQGKKTTGNDIDIRDRTALLEFTLNQMIEAGNSTKTLST